MVDASEGPQGKQSCANCGNTRNICPQHFPSRQMATFHALPRLFKQVQHVEMSHGAGKSARRMARNQAIHPLRYLSLAGRNGLKNPHHHLPFRGVGGG
jgi:Na+-translocating ferredoxin:NAD+ oxidoreductase RnfC subunit